MEIIDELMDMGAESECECEVKGILVLLLGDDDYDDQNIVCELEGWFNSPGNQQLSWG